MMPGAPETPDLFEERRKVYRVSEITRAIKQTIEDAFGRVWIEGEVSNLRRPSSGHMYFTIKDESAQIAAVLFRGAQRALSFLPEDGQQVRVYGELTVYERSGRYQVLVRQLERAGRGSLQEAFEQLKRKLAGEGLFAPERKRAIPMLPRRIAVVTSPTGAAIRDIFNVLSRRFPNLHIVVAPVRVQGPGAAPEIAHAVDAVNRLGGVDVMMVGRGGGSLEDLWAFNEEIVARAIARSEVPVIAAVGHEIDFTIAGFTADLRAPTPSAAAELVVGQKDEMAARVRDLGRRLERALRSRAQEGRHRFAAAARSYVFREPGNLVRRYRQRTRELETLARHALSDRLNQDRQRADEAALRLAHAVRTCRDRQRQDLRRLASQLRALSPQSVLERGFSVTRRADGSVVRDAARVRAGEPICSRLARGSLLSKVESVTTEEASHER
jgi:exodeoxyribonuclease VII large subunit